MTILGQFLRPLAIAIIVAMAAVAALGFQHIRKDLQNLQSISQDNFLWSATQMEVELLRFDRTLALFYTAPSEAGIATLHERLDILWSRVALMSQGRVGETLRHYDEGYGTLDRLKAFLEEIDPIILGMTPEDVSAIPAILRFMEQFQPELRLYTLRVVRGDIATASAVRERMLRSALITGVISLTAVAISLISLFLIMRENKQQRQIAALSRRQAETAEATSRAKSRFLTMMSHELRNPLNGVLGPLALLGQSDLGDKQGRLVDQAKQSGRAMLRMLAGLLDYGDIQDERIILKREPFRPQQLADGVRAALRDVPMNGEAKIEVRVGSTVPELVRGDLERLRQIFAHLGEYILQANEPSDVTVTFGHDGTNLIGEIAFADTSREMGWKLDLIMGMSELGSAPFSTDALGPLIARGLLKAAHGVLTLAECTSSGARMIRVAVPAEPVVFDKVRVHLETRSSALATLYRAALKSDRVAFLPAGSAGPADIVLVDTTSVGEGSLMGGLRARFPDALFVSLGLPASPGFFDDIVEAPHDMARLRKSVLGRLAS